MFCFREFLTEDMIIFLSSPKLYCYKFYIIKISLPAQVVSSQNRNYTLAIEMNDVTDLKTCAICQFLHDVIRLICA